MKIKDLDDAFYWWLEELPIDEIDCEQAQEIIKQYRNGTIDVLEASERLEVFCESSIRNWIDSNRDYQKMFKQIKDL